MKSFRKTLQESRLKTHHLIRSWLQPKLGAVGTRYRLAGRIRLANICLLYTSPSPRDA